eukprot:818733-Amphidinium_carterae.1
MAICLGDLAKGVFIGVRPWAVVKLESSTKLIRGIFAAMLKLRQVGLPSDAVPREHLVPLSHKHPKELGLSLSPPPCQVAQLSMCRRTRC